MWRQEEGAGQVALVYVERNSYMPLQAVVADVVASHKMQDTKSFDADLEPLMTFSWEKLCGTTGYEAFRGCHGRERTANGRLAAFHGSTCSIVISRFEVENMLPSLDVGWDNLYNFLTHAARCFMEGALETTEIV